MPYYNLLVVSRHKTLSTPAQNCNEALAIFGRELGLKLSLKKSDATVGGYFLDEWEVGPHWVSPTIPVFAMST